ncbi:hypothetical protein C5613_18990 [Rhodococcus opacus]|uniref:Uncharacterized protein n=1 Tax=Rhodococcus opacus TaxID=37919 RepID=A0A2S8J8Q6_RHOOP|nr:hypothetical protein C5613_18990 [Rhodococcus opacus]
MGARGDSAVMLVERGTPQDIPIDVPGAFAGRGGARNGVIDPLLDDFGLVGDVPCSAPVDRCFEEKMRAQFWGGQDGCDRGNLLATTDRSWSTCQALHTI